MTTPRCRHEPSRLQSDADPACPHTEHPACPMMTPTSRTTPGGTMRTRLTLAATGAALLLALTGCGYSADDCAAAITDESTKTNRPTECQDISDDDYETLILGHFLKKEGLDEVDEHPEDLLDYAEDGDVDRDQ